MEWHSVTDLYHKNRWTMPSDALLGLGVDNHLAVTAFLLEANGFPPGNTYSRAREIPPATTSSQGTSRP